MAGLKIVLKDTAGNPTDDISVEGYVAVTENFILSQAGYNSFEGTGAPGARADTLQQVVTTNVPTSVVTTLNKDVAISSGNCHISAKKDDNHIPGQAPAHITVPMPPAVLTSLGYLDEYILALNALVSAGDLSKARRFLYGVMMLTRCR